MEEDNATPNLDLNLGPVDNTTTDNDLASESETVALMNLEEWLQDPHRRIREADLHRNGMWRSFWRRIPIPQETRNLAMELINGNEMQTGHVDRSVAAKLCENSSKDEALDKNKDGEKDNFDEGNFFDCNICLDLAKEPVVTCCGHLFCWTCIYRWLHLHSEAKECPVCKGEVTTKKVTPIYGNGFHTREPNMETLKIPFRPQAQRIESWRQSVQRTAFTIPMEEMIRRLGATFELSHELVHLPPSLNPNAPPRESTEVTNSLLNRLMTNRGLRRDTSPVVATDEAIDLTEVSTQNLEAMADELLAADRSPEVYFNDEPLFERYQDLALAVDDRNSMSSSIAAVILSESVTIDNNAVEISSTLAQRSTSSSRRRNDSSRASDVDSGDSRPSSRRRLY